MTEGGDSLSIGSATSPFIIRLWRNVANPMNVTTGHRRQRMEERRSDFQKGIHTHIHTHIGLHTLAVVRELDSKSRIEHA